MCLLRFFLYSIINFFSFHFSFLLLSFSSLFLIICMCPLQFFLHPFINFFPLYFPFLFLSFSLLFLIIYIIMSSSILSSSFYKFLSLSLPFSFPYFSLAFLFLISSCLWARSVCVLNWYVSYSLLFFFLHLPVNPISLLPFSLSCSFPASVVVQD